MKKETKLTRRQVLRLSALAGTGAVLAACAAPAQPAAPTQPAAPAEPAQPAATEAPAPTEAPAAPAGGTVQVLHRQEYFKALEEELKKQTEEFITSLGYTPDVSTVNP